MFLVVSWQIWHHQSPFVLLQVGGWCVNQPVSTDMERHIELTHKQIWRLMKALLVRRLISEAKSQYLQYRTPGSPSTVSTENVTLNGSPSTTSKGGWQKTVHHLTLAKIKLFLLGRELVFCCRCPAWSGTCQRSLLTWNTWIVTTIWWVFQTVTS